MRRVVFFCCFFFPPDYLSVWIPAWRHINLSCIAETKSLELENKTGNFLSRIVHHAVPAHLEHFPIIFSIKTISFYPLASPTDKLVPPPPPACIMICFNSFTAGIKECERVYTGHLWRQGYSLIICLQCVSFLLVFHYRDSSLRQLTLMILTATPSLCP